MILELVAGDMGVAGEDPDCGTGVGRGRTGAVDRGTSRSELFGSEPVEALS